jgi:hypothetical protein
MRCTPAKCTPIRVYSCKVHTYDITPVRDARLQEMHACKKCTPVKYTPIRYCEGAGAAGPRVKKGSGAEDQNGEQ